MTEDAEARIWSFALDEHPDDWTGAHASREEAIAEGRIELDRPATFYVCSGHRPRAMDFCANAESYLQDAQERACDEIGDAAEDWPDVGREAGAELDALLAAWVAKHLEPMRFWVVDGVPERIDAVRMIEIDSKATIVVVDRYERAMAIETEDEADAYFEGLVQLAIAAGLERADAERTQRGNLGYVAGYYGNEVRERVERLFRCAHPIFGAIAVHGPPTPEQAFAAGVALGKAARERAL